MKLTFIITIDPIKDISYLNIMVHSLNLQTCRDFNVVFYNQTRMSEAEIMENLAVNPNFEYRLCDIEKDMFLGKYPIWDLYAFHSYLIENDYVEDYFMSLHMEEFLDVDYVEHILPVLERQNLDILFGNLTRSRIEYDDIAPILAANDHKDYDHFIDQLGIKDAHHWSFFSEKFFTDNRGVLRENLMNFWGFGLRRKPKPNARGYVKPPWYVAEDVFFMKKEFARQYNWFLSGHHMYFEDVHICEIPGVCHLGRELKKVTKFPAYFNLRNIYHISHSRFYFQLQDEDFTSGMQNLETDDPILLALKEAINQYKSGEMTMWQALNYSRRNPLGTGTQNLNYKYHLKYLHNGK